MKAKNISYPHPILGNEDDMQGEFKPSFRHALKREKIGLKVGFALNNKTLERLIQEHKAAFIIEVECGSTFFRSHFSTFEKEAEFAVPSSRVRELVNVGFYIRAVEPISGYMPEGCHPDYKEFSFEIGIGDVLAVGGFTSFIPEKEFDPLKPSVSSFMAIKRGNHQGGPMVVDYGDHDKIIIKLSQSDWENYILVKGRTSVAPILHSAIVLSVLADAINLVKNHDNEASGNHWFQRLEVIMQQKGLLDEEPLASAQLILNSPVGRGLISLAAPSQEEE